MPGLTIGDTVPNLEVESTHGVMKLHEYIGDSWTILFSHPGDFTPVCTTELGKMAAYAEEFAKKGVKLLGLSHVEWIKDIEAYTPVAKVTYPIIADPDRRFVKELNMVDPDEKDNSGNILPSRALHVVGPDKKIKLSFLYPATTGRNMDDVMRVVESLQRASKHKIATPVNWKPGENVVISPNVSNEEAKKMFPQGYKTVDLTFHPIRNTCASLMLTPSKVHHCNGVCSLSGHVSSFRTYMNTLLTVFIIACDPFVKLD